MAEEEKTEASAEVDCPTCEECPPAGSPAWMATFSDLVTLMLTFFILLYAMSKQDDSKFNSVAGSIRKAFAGNAMKIGETIQLGKSPDDSPTMIESQEPIEPFPIDLLTTEGILDKLEINRESEEDLANMKQVLKNFNMENMVEVEQLSEGVKIRLKEKIYFKFGTTEMIKSNAVETFQKVVKLLRSEDWKVFVEGHASNGEKGADGSDPYLLSAKRAQEVAQALVKRGVSPGVVTAVFYGDTRKMPAELKQSVEFILRKRDLRTKGRQVSPY